MPATSLKSLLDNNQESLLAAWQADLAAALRTGAGRISDAELKTQTHDFLRLVTEAIQHADVSDIEAEGWSAVRRFLSEVSRTRVLQGFSSAETATFVFSLKRPIFSLLRQAYAKDAEALAEQTWIVSLLLDQLGLVTVRAFQLTREELINRQQTEMLELSTPVVKLWEGVLALPVIGTLDSARTQVMMESLLQKIVDTGSELAIIDITGVPTVDTLVAQHLLRTVTAIRLMGAECIVSGLRPQIAQTIVHLGVDLHGIITKATLAEALSLAMSKLNLVVSRTA